MKKISQSIFFLTCLLLCVAGSLQAQAPQGFNYQAVVRDGSGNIVSSSNVGMRFSLRQGNSSGTIVYQETYTAPTNSYGLIALTIGEGTAVTGSMTDIDWGSDAWYLQVEADPTGGSNYANMGTTRFMSVPYALYAEKTNGLLEVDNDVPGPGQQVTLGPENSGKIFTTEHTGRPFFPENLPDGFHCTIVNFSNFSWPSNTLATAEFFSVASGWSTASGEAEFSISSGGTAHIYVTTSNGQKAYFISGDVFH